MGLKELNHRIETKEAKLSVIGLGYVGLPVACMFAKAGFDVEGIDTNEDKVRQINGGILPIEGFEPGLKDLLVEMVTTGRLQANNNYRSLANKDLVIICVETPVNENHEPRYEAFRSCLQSLAPEVKESVLIIVESTIAPGTMNNLVGPMIESGSGKKVNETIFLGHCPERVMPGRLLQNLRTMSRVVGGMNPETAQVMARLYAHIVESDLDQADCVTAELVKTTENAYRDVQIAFANEIALISEAVGGDVWKVRDLVNKSPGRQMLMPGAGVGGHCIPKDPWLLVYGVKGKKIPLQLITSAREINDYMPEHIADLLKEVLAEKDIKVDQAKILILGYAYLENSDDVRNSPSAVAVQILKNSGAQPVIHDPYVRQYKGDLFQKAKGCDAVILMVKHREYAKLNFKKLAESVRTPIFIDGRGLLSQKELEAAGFAYTSIGVGSSKIGR